MLQSRRNVVFFILVLLSSVYFYPKDITTIANPIVIVETSSGGILPGNDTTLQMVEANVLMEINESYGIEGEFEIFFDGNYTIYNPDNFTEILLAAPFQSDYVSLNSTLRIEVNGTEVDYYIIYFDYYNETENPWRVYFLEDWSTRFFAICNASFAGQANTTIRYTFYSLFNGGQRNSIQIIYDVGTANAWDGVTTETVEFKVYGKEPDFYYPNEDYCESFKPTITDIENGKSYLWFWFRSTFTECRRVNVGYSAYDPWTWSYSPSPTQTTLYFEYFFSLLGIIIIVSTLKKIRVKP
ncbi:MAG: hypothetical protein ACTSQF_11160 [Candidatus Heimdallarchaeaceae archaeon]